mgnify:FL=1
MKQCSDEFIYSITGNRQDGETYFEVVYMNLIIDTFLIALLMSLFVILEKSRKAS